MVRNSSDHLGVHLIQYCCFHQHQDQASKVVRTNPPLTQEEEKKRGKGRRRRKDRSCATISSWTYRTAATIKPKGAVMVTLFIYELFICLVALGTWLCQQATLQFSGVLVGSANFSVYSWYFHADAGTACWLHHDLPNGRCMVIHLLGLNQPPSLSIAWSFQLCSQNWSQIAWHHSLALLSFSFCL